MALPSKLILAVGGVAVLAAAGWFGWQQFSDSGRAPASATTSLPKPKRPAAPKPGAAGPAAAGADAPAGPAAPASGTQAQVPVNPDQLIDQVLIATGLARQLDSLPEQVLGAVKASSAGQPQAAQALSKDLERIFAESFTKEGFQRRVKESLKAGYDEKRLRALLSAASAPVAKKMTELELAKPSEAEQATFIKNLASKPLPRERQALLQRLDDASNASGLGTEIALASVRAMALGAAGSDSKAAAAIDAAMESQRAALSANVRKGSMIAMAFAYRAATDAELGEYIKIYESDHGKWFTGVVSTAIVAEFKSAAGQVGQKIAALVKDRQPAQSAKAQAAEPAAPVAKTQSGNPPQPGATRTAVASRQGGRDQDKDVRSCLGLPTTVEVIKCAEQGR
jgi:hypothetical protein